MCASLIQRLRNCRRGSIPIMTGFLMIPMVAISGGAIDLVAYERMRTRMQDSLDRGVLAAASLSQTSPTRETIESFVRPAMSPRAFTLDYTETTATNARRVEATLSAEMDTAFLTLVGIDEMMAEVESKAEETRSNIEISLILDVSGSMRFNGAGVYPGPGKPMRIDYLRPAAKSFLDVVLDDEASAYTTVNVVPFAGQVSIGAPLFDLLMPGRRSHSKSSCIEFKTSDFVLGKPDFANRDQVPHFTQSNHHDRLNANEQKSTEPWWCADDPHAAIPTGQPDWVRNEGVDSDTTIMSILSNDRLFLQNQIDHFKLYDGTGTPNAMKWALLMLDPVMRPVVGQIAASSTLSAQMRLKPQFANRPADFTDDGTMKFIVLMTDGAISSQVRPADTSNPIQYYNDSSKNSTKFSEATAASYTQSLCKAAKDKGIRIFTIGFDINDTAAKQMRDCAYDPSYFYRVNSLNIADAFKSIATAIQQIKLVG